MSVPRQALWQVLGLESLLRSRRDWRASCGQGAPLHSPLPVLAPCPGRGGFVAACASVFLTLPLGPPAAVPVCWLLLPSQHPRPPFPSFMCHLCPSSWTAECPQAHPHRSGWLLGPCLVPAAGARLGERTAWGCLVCHRVHGMEHRPGVGTPHH